MKSGAPPLLPILRSRHQADLLTWLFFHPGKEFTLTELADRIGASTSTVHNEAARLEQHGIVRWRNLGRARLLQANLNSRIADPLSQLLLLTFGPWLVVREEFARLEGIEKLLIYGSWAARYEGEPGPMPADVDVLVVGGPDRAEVYAAADRSEARLELPVNPTVRSLEQWESRSDALVTSIKAAPSVDLDLRVDAPDAVLR